MSHQSNTFAFKPIFTLKELSFEIGVPVDVISKQVQTVEHSYNPFWKSKVGKKRRRISNPNRSLKLIQRRIAKRLLSRVELPTEMYGGVKKKNLLQNALPHVDQRVVVSIDIANCFPSISHTQIFKLFREKMGFSKEVANHLTRLTTFRGKLPQGAPTSSVLANIILTPVCIEIRRYLYKRNCQLSFWADDITFSGRDAHKHLDYVANLLRSHGFRISAKKVKVQFSGQNQSVTSLVVNKKVSVSKRKINEAVQQKSEGTLNKESKKGIIEFVRFVNPVQASRLIKILS